MDHAADPRRRRDEHNGMKRPPNFPVADTHDLDRRLYGAMALLALLVVLWGFARTFFLRWWFENPPLSALVFGHGLLMTAWYALFIAQVALIRMHRPQIHRRLGLLTASVGFAVVPSGIAVAVGFVQRLHSSPDDAAFAALVAGYDFVALAVFWFLVCTALFLRRRGEFHKRLMLLASLSLLAPPLARLVGDEAAVWLGYGLLLIPMAIDTWRHRRLHPAFGWGAALIVLSSRIALHYAAQPRWIEFCSRTLT